MPTQIEWCEETWNPIVGCTAVSPGCAHCYASAVAHREMQPSHKGLTNPRGHWTGEVRCLPDRLAYPLYWRKPRRVFVCSMSDLFHDDVPETFIDTVIAVMVLSRQHTFQLLTKRAERMRDYMAELSSSHGRRVERLSNAAYGLGDENECHVANILNGHCPPAAPWPLPNVWLGVSCEDQQRADERIPLLLQTPAAVRFVSAEPLLGPIRLDRIDGAAVGADLAGIKVDALNGGRESKTPWHLNWVIVGGESGPGARPMDLAWALDLRSQCVAAACAFFFKQGGASNRCAHSAKGACLDCVPAELRMREFPR